MADWRKIGDVTAFWIYAEFGAIPIRKKIDHVRKWRGILFRQDGNGLFQSTRASIEARDMGITITGAEEAKFQSTRASIEARDMGITITGAEEAKFQSTRASIEARDHRPRAGLRPFGEFQSTRASIEARDRGIHGDFSLCKSFNPRAPRSRRATAAELANGLDVRVSIHARLDRGARPHGPA